MLRAYASRYREELLQRVIPFWMNHSLDREHGGYFTCLTREGAVYDSRKYVWLQGRAVWMLAKLYNEVEQRREWIDAARLILDFLRKHARDAEGRYYFSLSRDGRPSFFQRKPYSAVFAMLGMLEFSKATGDAAMKQEALDLFWRIRSWIDDPGLLGRPTLAGAPKLRALADVMIVASMACEIARIDADPRYRDVLRKCVEQSRDFYDPARRVFFEYAPLDASLPEGRFFCPGDSIECAWFLLHALEFAPDAAAEKMLLDSIEGSLEMGWDREFGGLYYFVDGEGLPPLPLESNMKLSWPHTEAIYATILAYSNKRDPKWLSWFCKVDTYALTHFSDAAHGEWFGYCDRRGQLTNSAKANNYKASFHCPRILLLTAQFLEVSAT